MHTVRSLWGVLGVLKHPQYFGTLLMKSAKKWVSAPPKFRPMYYYEHPQPERHNVLAVCIHRHKNPKILIELEFLTNLVM